MGSGEILRLMAFFCFRVNGSGEAQLKEEEREGRV